MSTRTERSAWSHLEEADCLENVDKEIQLVSTSTESNTISHYSNENKPIENVEIIPENKPKNVEETLNNDDVDLKTSNRQKKLHLKLHSSFDDLCVGTGIKVSDHEPSEENQHSNVSGPVWPNLKQNDERTKNKKYGHVQSKVKHYFDVKHNVTKKINSQSPVSSEPRGDKKKEDYLEEINKQLTKELEEKNAILSLLQENYERLLFKYAEAQNRIDELRFKCMTENSESKNCVNQNKNNSTTNADIKFKCNDVYVSKVLDINCQRTGPRGDDQPYQSPKNHVNPSQSGRPLSLPLDATIKVVDRDVIMTKATTPTDSEGLSSIITSMSGHSKILNSLDEENQINKKSNSFKCSSGNFILESNANANDPFDKVKNWQNSLPPLEQIETPETALYNAFPSSSGEYSSGETKYNEISSPKMDNDYAYLDESCPPSWRDENVSLRKGKKYNSNRVTSLPGTLNQRNSLDSTYGQKGYHSVDMEDVSNGALPESRTSDGGTQRSKTSVSFKRKGRRRGRRPPLLRCSSLPTYNQDGMKCGILKNGIYIPPLDLGNVTLSDDESYCQQDYYLSKSNGSSCVTSRGGSNDRYSQTPQSFSSYKNTISEDNFFPRVPTTDKSTSITPERNKPPSLCLGTPKNNCSKGDGSKYGKTKSSWISVDRPRDKTQNCCNICGESMLQNAGYAFVRNRSNSCESVHSNELEKNEIFERNRSKVPFKRSISFGSEAVSPKYCSHEGRMQNNFHMIPSQECLENFEVYANSLKARSQVAMKALTAHMNNS